jgi:hypothetical protein
MATMEEVAAAMFKLVQDYHGKKNLKALDLRKAMIEKFGEDQCDKKLCKLAIRELIDSGSAPIPTWAAVTSYFPPRRREQDRDGLRRAGRAGGRYLSRITAVRAVTA